MSILMGKISESSEWSSSGISGEENEVEQLLHAAQTKEQGYLNALDFSLSFSPDNKIPNLFTSADSCYVEGVLFKIDGTTDYASHPFYKETNLLVTKPKFLQTHMRNSELLKSVSDLSENTSKVDISNKNWHTLGTCVSSRTCSLLPWKLKYDSPVFKYEPNIGQRFIL